MALQVPALDLRLLTFRASEEGDRIRVKMAGTADLGAREELRKTLDQLHAEALRLKKREIVVDCRDLEFMNSGCFQVLLLWIGRLQTTPPESQYRIRILGSREVHWQKRSFTAVRLLAEHLISVELS